MPRGDRGNALQKRNRVDEDGADAAVASANPITGGNGPSQNPAPNKRPKFVRKTEAEDSPILQHNTTNNNSQSGSRAVSAAAALPDAAQRHGVDTEEDVQQRGEEDDEEWEDEEVEGSDADSLPEEIIDEGEYDEEDDEEGAVEGTGEDGTGGAAAAGAGDDDEVGGIGEISKTAGKKGGGGKAVRFVDGPDAGDGSNAAGALNHSDELQAKVWRPDREAKKAGANGQQPPQEMKLTYSNRAYDSFFQLRTEYPALSFAVLRDYDGDVRTKYPMSMYLACGTQAPRRNENQIVLLQLTNLGKTKYDEASDSDEEEIGMVAESSSEDDDDDLNDELGDEEGDKAGRAGLGRAERKDLRAAAREREEVNNGEGVVNARTIPFPGTVNRLRCKEDASHIIAAWCSDDGTVRVVDAMDEARALADFEGWSRDRAANYKTPAKNPHVFSSAPRNAQHHRTEGYGLGWARAGDTTRFASGDNNGNIVLWQAAGSGAAAGWKAAAAWHRDAPSVEEIVWSAVEPTVFIAARAGGTVEVWDTRDMRSCRLHWRADPTDINVCDWNRAAQNSHLLVTGADSGIIGVWDLRRIMQGNTEALQRLNFHQGSSITSIEFSVHNETVLSATSSDGQCTLWDLCVERDIDEEREMVGSLFGRPDVSELPDALMFQHQGLYAPKEAHFHPQLPGVVVTTDFHGLNVFRPCNWKSLMK